jgi:hypothetical protein
MRPHQWSISLLYGMLMAGCTNTNAVAWDEEVALNTGDVVIVRREQTYQRGSEPGNPLKPAWIAKTPGTMRFHWRGHDYTFNQHSVPTVLAISPEGQPVVLANASIGGWDQDNGFGCRTPFYVQFTPDPTGQNWTWPASIAPWAHGMAANLLVDIPRPEEGRRRYSAAEVRTLNEGLASPRQYVAIDPAFAPAHCAARKSPS